MLYTGNYPTFVEEFVMKNRVWSWLTALMLLAAVLVFAVSAQTTEPVCPHCNVALSQITW